MNFVMYASKLMTVAEVKKQCKEWRENPVLLLDQEFEAKEKLFGLKRIKAVG